MAKENVFQGLPENLPKPEVKPSTLPPELQDKTVEETYEILKAEHERLMAEQEARTRAPEQPPAPPQPTAPRFVPPPPQRTEIPDPGYDPEGYARFVGETTARRLQPMVEVTLNSLKEHGRMALAQKRPEEYTQFKDEVESMVNGLDPQLQADPKSWDTALDFVLAKHVKEVTESRAKVLAREMLKEMGHEVPNEEQPVKKSTLFESRVPVVTSMPRGGPQRQKPRLSENEEKARRRIAPEMTPEEWIKYRGLNTDVLTAQEGERV